MRRWWVIGGSACLFLVLIAVAAAAGYDHGHSRRLAAGIHIGDVDVGGLDADAAALRVRRLGVQPRLRDLTVHAAGRSFVLPAAKLHLTADVDAAIERALSASRSGWFVSRAARDLTGGHVDEQIPLVTHYAPGVIGPLADEVAAKTAREPVDASVKPDASGLRKTPSKPGLSVDARALRKLLAQAATSSRSHSADVVAPVHEVDAKVRAQDLDKKYPAYIVVDRKAHKLRFYEYLKLERTYDIAVGMSGLETPTGLYDVQWKEVDPPWHVPNSAWAGALAGKTIPPGPQDPIKSRWMAFDDGAGIHGIDPSEYGSIGHDASHGCVRMRIPDVISLYARTPIGTPVYVA
jgi:lipoprotein-anchoring transpeptidase ErfK/SrfK